MTKKKKKARAPKNKSEFELLIRQAGKTFIALADRGIYWAENAAREQNLFNEYPYLNRAIENVKNVMQFFTANIRQPKPSGKRKRKG